MFTFQGLCLKEKKSLKSVCLCDTFDASQKGYASFLPIGSACRWRWSNNFVLLENMLPHVGQATTLSWVWLRMCSLKRYFILKKASQPGMETRGEEPSWNLHSTRAGKVGRTVKMSKICLRCFTQSNLSSGRRAPAAGVGEVPSQRFQRDCPHVGKTTRDCWMCSVQRQKCKFHNGGGAWSF